MSFPRKIKSNLRLETIGSYSVWRKTIHGRVCLQGFFVAAVIVLGFAASVEAADIKLPSTLA